MPDLREQDVGDKKKSKGIMLYSNLRCYFPQFGTLAIGTVPSWTPSWWCTEVALSEIQEIAGGEDVIAQTVPTSALPNLHHDWCI